VAGRGGQALDGTVEIVEDGQGVPALCAEWDNGLGTIGEWLVEEWFRLAEECKLDGT
jgi:hypothetical protein